MDKEKNNTEQFAEQLTDRDVTAHTAALWKYKPVPESPEPYPESVCSEASSEGFEVIAASVRGKKHKHDGSNRDDAFAFDFCGGAVIAAVSDGAGSKPLSRIGAKCACDAVLNYAKIRMAAIERDIPDYREALGKAFDDPDFGKVCSELAGMLRDGCAEAYSAVEAAYEKRKELPEFEEALGRKPEIKDFACTLLISVIIPVETSNGREYLTAALQIGDGMIASFDENADFGNALVILGGADSGSFAGETEFITTEQMRSPDSLMSRTKIRRGKMTCLMLMTDGVADDYYPNDPQLLRLMLDLRLNGIKPVPAPGEDENGDTDVNIPKPAEYPWVNDSDVQYALQYTKGVLSESGITLEQLWKNKAVQGKSCLKAFDIVHEKTPKDMLQVWLDNYVERGSFDDRTLLIINVEE
ncbi:MAG: protein phosphatase 2C domain-containing protein [Oscillospiraceae bacterium]|nr:protein phosphatase 2C domain-containing protein [Oscillospiraceae bacterium]